MHGYRRLEQHAHPLPGLSAIAEVYCVGHAHVCDRNEHDQRRVNNLRRSRTITAVTASDARLVEVQSD
jgi:hypothetical protein